jgi:hypothetical protein
MRVIFGGILGGVALFMWGFAYWVILSPMLMPPKPVADEVALVAAMQENLAETGVYWLPPMPMPDASLDAAANQQVLDDWLVRHKAGPVGMVTFHAEGSDPNDPMRLVRGVIINIVSGLLASILLFSGCRGWGYGGRLMFLIGIGLLVSTSVHLVGWNFMYSPTEWTLFRIGDSVGGWFVAGIIIAAIVKRNVSSDPVYI